MIETHSAARAGAAPPSRRPIQALAEPIAACEIDFLVVDFETANQRRASACAIGIAAIAGGSIIHSASLLIDPEDYFTPMNIAIHGIRQEDVVGNPTFPEVWMALDPIARRTTLVAHNAPFDSGVLTSSLLRYNLPDPHYRWRCTLQLSRRLWPQAPNHRLDTLCALQSIPLQHHDARSDALAAARLLLILLPREEG